MNIDAGKGENNVTSKDNHFVIPESHKQHYKEFIVETISNEDNCIHCNIDNEINTPVDERNIVEVDCPSLLGQNFCLNSNNLELKENDKIVIKNGDFTDIAKVTYAGKMVQIRRQIFGLYGEELPEVIRLANEEDISKLNKNLNDISNAKDTFERLTGELNLDMKLVGIHYQFDRKKLFFFYTADGRVDFRELAKRLAGIYKTRIELRQIGVRDEAKLVGGVGTCGREFCCTTFLNHFKRITTDIASEQNISMNLSKLSGPCGKLKCCLAFELE